MARRTRLGWAKWGGAAALLCWGGAAPVGAAPTPAQVLNFKPRQPGVECTNPSPEQQKGCKVELVKSGRGSGWLLSDASGPIRRFFDSDGDNKIDTWSYYKDGVEVYREIDSNRNGKPDQYRWLNAGGMKWGLDQDEDGKIDTWKALSPEEASQEVLQAVAANDYRRLQALLLTEAEARALALDAAEAKRLRTSLAQAKAKFDAAVAKVKGSRASWLHLETSAPQCRPATGSGVDMVHHLRGTILYEASGKNDWLQTGEMVQVGSAWRLAGGPTPGGSVDQVPATGAPASSVNSNPKLQKLVEQLTELDKTPPKATGAPGPNAAVAEYNLKRADVLERVLAEVQGAERGQWIRQLADSLSTAVQNSAASDTTASSRLQHLENQVVASQPKSKTAAYVVFRRMQADYSVKLLKQGADFSKVQQEWMESLTKFVTTYPQGEDAADALLQLGMVSEFLAKDVEAKKWYATLAERYPDRAQAAKAKGAVRRLESVGRDFELTGPVLSGGAFDMSKVRGKVVAVYYWASWNQQSVGDFARLKQMVDAHGKKGFELVCVNLDNSAEEANGYLARSPAPGTHLHQAGSLESKLATDYGIMVLPHLFLVGKDGKVVSRTVQIGNLEDEVKKLLK